MTVTNPDLHGSGSVIEATIIDDPRPASARSVSLRATRQRGEVVDAVVVGEDVPNPSPLDSKGRPLGVADRSSSESGAHLPPTTAGFRTPPTEAARPAYLEPPTAEFGAVPRTTSGRHRRVGRVGLATARLKEIATEFKGLKVEAPRSVLDLSVRSLTRVIAELGVGAWKLPSVQRTKQDVIVTANRAKQYAISEASRVSNDVVWAGGVLKGYGNKLLDKAETLGRGADRVLGSLAVALTVGKAAAKRAAADVVDAFKASMQASAVAHNASRTTPAAPRS